jgi:hypothetical protein
VPILDRDEGAAGPPHLGTRETADLNWQEEAPWPSRTGTDKRASAQRLAGKFSICTKSRLHVYRITTGGGFAVFQVLWLVYLVM